MGATPLSAKDDMAVGVGAVYGQIGTLKHTRLDVYSVFKSMPDFTIKLGYVKQAYSLPGQDAEDSGWSKAPESDGLLLGVGYNLFTYRNFFSDAGVFYHYIISDKNADGLEYNGFDDGGYWKATKLTLQSNPGAELGFGYSFNDFTIRTDFTFMYKPVDLEGEAYNSSGVPSGDTEVSDSSNLFLTIGLIYWF